jgi:hypothetical protein
MVAPLVQALIRPADVAHDGELVARLVDEHRVVGGDETVGGRRHDRGPRVLADQAADLAGVGQVEDGIVPHRYTWSFGHQ